MHVLLYSSVTLDFLSENFSECLESDALFVDHARLQAALGQLVEVTLPTRAEELQQVR